MISMYKPFAVKDTKIETERLILRGWQMTDQDAQDMYAYAQYEKVGRPAGWHYHRSVDESREILQMFVEEDNCFAIIDKESGKAIGSLGLHQPRKEDAYPDKASLEIGYVLSPDFWGKGLMPEAVKAVIDWLFANTDTEVIFCGHFDFNDKSRRVIEKCGFTYLETVNVYAKQVDERFDELIYYRLKE